MNPPVQQTLWLDVIPRKSTPQVIHLLDGRDVLVPPRATLLGDHAAICENCGVFLTFREWGQPTKYRCQYIKGTDHFKNPTDPACTRVKPRKD